MQNLNINISKMSDFMNLVNGCKDPKTFAMNLLQAKAGEDNPVIQNLFNLAQQGNSTEIEKIARNIATEKGVDFDKEFNAFRQIFKL